MTDAEAAFRRVETVLDNSLKVASGQLAAVLVSVRDESARYYHYKNELLSWRQCFEVRFKRGPFIAKIEVSIEFDEFIVSQIPAWVRDQCRAELFLLGQSPVWENVVQGSIEVGDLVQIGVGDFVCERLANGRAALDDACMFWVGKGT